MKDFATRLLHVGVEMDKHMGALNTPIYQVVGLEDTDDRLADFNDNGG